MICQAYWMWVDWSGPKLERTASLHYYLLGGATARTHRQLEKVHDSEAVSRKACYKWFEKFDSCDHSLKDMPQSGAAGRWHRWLKHRALYQSGNNSLLAGLTANDLAASRATEVYFTRVCLH